MGTRHLCRIRLAADSRADAFDFIRRKGNAKPRTADQDSLLYLSCCHCPCHFLPVDRVIAALRGIRPVINNFVSLFFQKINDLSFQFQRGMIISDSYLHNMFPSFLQYNFPV